MKFSLKSHFINRLLLEDTEWKQHFINGTKGMPKADPQIIDYVQDLYDTTYFGQPFKAKLSMAKWMIGVVMNLSTAVGGIENITTDQRNKMLTVLGYARMVGGEGNISKLTFDEALKTAEEKLSNKKTAEEKPVPEEPKTPAFELPILDAEAKGLAKRIWHSNDGSGTIMVKVNQSKAPEFFKYICKAGNKMGVECQQRGNYDSMTYTNITLIGPNPKGDLNAPASTLVAIALTNKSIVQLYQVRNVNIGTQDIYGYSDLDRTIVDFLCSSAGKEEVHFCNWTALWSVLLKKNVDSLYKLDELRPDLIKDAEKIIQELTGGKEWFANRNLNAIDIATKNPERFLENIHSYSKSKDYKEALQILIPKIPEIAKKHPMLILNNINVVMDYVPFELFNSIIKNINLTDYIKTRKEDFERFVKKSANVNSKDAKSYKKFMEDVIEKNTPAIIESFGGRGVGLVKFLDFLSMPRIEKHTFSKKLNGQIYANKEEVTVNPDGSRNSKIVEFPLKDDLSIMPQKERRDLIIKNEANIKNFFEGTDEDKKIKYLRFLFLESNQQDVERTLNKEKQEFINYYNLHPNKLTGYPGIFEFYAIFNKNKPSSVVSQSNAVANLYTNRYGRGEEEDKISRTYYKMDLADLRNVENIKKIIKWYYEKSDAITVIGKKYDALSDYFKTLELSGESPEIIYNLMVEKYSPEKLSGIDMSTYDSYKTFFDMIHYFFPDKTKSTIESLAPNIKAIGKTGEQLFKDLLSKYLEKGYDVSEQDFVEFTGEDKDRKFNDFLEKLPFMTPGKKYNVGEVSDGYGYKNGRIRVYNDGKKLSDWIPTSMFKAKTVLMEDAIRSYIRQKIKKKVLCKLKK